MEGERSAAIYLIGSAKLNSMDPEAYLRNVLDRIAEYRSTAFIGGKCLDRTLTIHQAAGKDRKVGEVCESRAVG